MSKRWLLVLMMMLVTLQTFTVAADVHNLAPVAHTAEELRSFETAVADKHYHEHGDLCQSSCQSCCHHGFFQVLVPQPHAEYFIPAPVLVPAYTAVFSSLPAPVLFRPPKA